MGHLNSPLSASAAASASSSASSSAFHYYVTISDRGIVNHEFQGDQGTTASNDNVSDERRNFAGSAKRDEKGSSDGKGGGRKNSGGVEEGDW